MRTPSVPWQLKARIQRLCARLPGGERLYYQLQRRFGNLRHPDFLERMGHARGLALLARQHGVGMEGAIVYEVGTGWIPTAPIAFSLLGARRVITVDIHRYLSLDLTHQLAVWMSERREELIDLYRDLAPVSLLTDRLAMMSRFKHDPVGLLRSAGIDYQAPADATRTGLADGSVDLHFSYNVFEHVPPVILETILAEARRILRPDGLTLHYVDPTDHFAHMDHSLSNVHFLRYESAAWEELAGNPFAYTNRLCDPDYRAMFLRQGLDLREARFDVDPHALSTLRAGAPLAREFRGKDFETLSRKNLVYVAARRDAMRQVRAM